MTQYEIEVVPVADDKILEYAEAGVPFILTRDRFIDHRRRHRWIEQSSERFFRWRLAGGAVSFVPGDIRVEPHQVISEHEEVKDLKRSGLDFKRHREVLQTRWRCENARCLHARLWQDALLLWPAVDRAGRVTCPGCGGTLTRLGRRAATRQVIVSSVDGGEEFLRFPLEAGSPVTVGRGRLENGISLDTPGAPERIGRLSRQHLMLHLNESGMVEMVDLGSSNGTTVHRSTADAGHTLEAGVRLDLPNRGLLRLGKVVQMELSGQKFLVDTRLPSNSATEAPTTEVPA